MSLFGGPTPIHDPQVKQAAWSDLSRWEAEGRANRAVAETKAGRRLRTPRAGQGSDRPVHTQNLPDAKEAFELSVIGYRQGRGSWPQVQIAQRNYFRMSTEYVEALAELRRAELLVLGLLMDAPEESTTQTAQK